jgi:hypothetical protein
MNARAFTTKLLTCVQEDWQLDGGQLLALLSTQRPPEVGLAKPLSWRDVSAPAAFERDTWTDALQEDPHTALCTALRAYVALLQDAKRTRKEGDPWPIFVIDEANALMKWEDAASRETLLTFFVRLTQQEQLEHVILATGDTILTQWLRSGARRA